MQTMTGIQWQAPNKNYDLEKELVKAAARYYEKTGKVPTRAEVHPSKTNGTKAVEWQKGLPPVEIHGKQHIQPHLILIGVMEVEK